MFGYELSDLIGRNALEFSAPESRDFFLRKIRSGYEQPYEAVGLRKDSTAFPVEIVGKAIVYQERAVTSGHT